MISVKVKIYHNFYKVFHVNYMRVISQQQTILQIVIFHLIYFTVINLTN